MTRPGRQHRTAKERVLAAHRANPQATNKQIAAAARCHPSTVAKHRPARRPEQPAPTAGDTRSGSAAGAGPPLRTLALNPDPAVRAGVATNPNISQGLLSKLADDPADDVRAAVAANPRTPAEALDALGADRAAAEAVATNPNSPASALAEVVRIPESSFDAKRRAGLHPNCDLKSLQDIGPAAAVFHPDCPEAQLVRSARHPAPMLRRAAASHPRTPPEILASLIHDDPAIAQAALRNPNCPRDALDSAARGDDPAERSAALRNPNCRASTLVEAASSHERSARIAVIRNPNCPPEALEVMGIAGSAADPLCSPATLTQLALADHSTRRQVAGHHRSPVQALEHLASDPWPDVREAVARSPQCPQRLLDQLADDNDPMVRHAVACAAHCSPETLEQLVTEPSPRLRAAVAQHCLTPSHIVTQLAADGSELVRVAVAGNPLIPPAARAVLMTSTATSAVQAALAANPSTL